MAKACRDTAPLRLQEERREAFDWFGDPNTVYGFPCTADPRDFLPGFVGEDCTPDELARWYADYQRVDSGGVVDWPGDASSPDGSVHFAQTRWGLGITRLRGAE